MLDTKEIAQSFFDLEAWATRAFATYNWAASVREYEDLDKPAQKVFRCSTFLFGCVALAVASITLLLVSLNINVLNMARGWGGAGGISATAMQFAQDLGAALPTTSFRNLSLTRQSGVLLVTFGETLALALLLSFAVNARRAPHVSQRRKAAFTSLLVSLGLAHFSAACALVSVLTLALRYYGFVPNNHSLVFIAIVLATLASVPLLTHYARLKRAPHDAKAAGAIPGAAFFSAVAPVLVAYILMWNATWVGDRFKPTLTVMLSESCGAPDKGTCVLSFMPRDIDGTTALEGIRFQLLLGYADEMNIVGPRHLTPVMGHLRVIQNPDTPLPLQVSNDVVVGVAGYTHVDCPPKLARGTRKLIIISYSAYADTRSMDIADFARVDVVPLRFTYQGELLLLFRNASNGCSFFP